MDSEAKKHPSIVVRDLTGEATQLPCTMCVKDAEISGEARVVYALGFRPLDSVAVVVDN